MRYEDRLAIGTPEGLRVEMVLAGIGSRFVASVVDSIIKGAFLVLCLLLLALVGSKEGLHGTGTVVVIVLTIIAFFCALFVYDIVFEVWSGGRTPGKRVAGVRVLMDGGMPITLTASTIRNLLRLIDFLPISYLVGIISIAATKANKRLGDLAAGTIVVREPKRDDRVEEWNPPRWVAEESAGWDVSAITAEESATVASFIARREGLEAEARARVAGELARRLYPKVRGAPSNLQAEGFLERLLVAKRQRS